MTIYDPEGTHTKYTATDTHWCPQSQGIYTGADSLLSAQRNGWRLTDLAYYEMVILGGSRQTTLYHFLLMKDGETRWMPILRNPFIERMLRSRDIQLLPLDRTPIPLDHQHPTDLKTLTMETAV